MHIQNKMDINLFIKTLLLKNKSVIVPGFGGFTLQSKKARIDEVNRMAYPPKKQVQFDPKIKIDDAKQLEKLILEKDEKNGKKSLEIFVDQLNDSLNNKKEVHIEGLGTIQKKDNLYTFIPEKEFSELLNPHQPIALPVREKKTPPDTKKTDTRRSPEKVPMPAPAKSGKGNKNTTILLIMASIFVLLSLGTILMIFLTEDKVQKSLPVKETKVKTPPPLFDPSTEVPEKETEDKNIYANFTKFSLVTGSFLSKRNAIQHQKELYHKGFSESQIIKHDTLFRVCIKSFDDRKTALKHLKQIRDEKGKSFVWLLSHN